MPTRRAFISPQCFSILGCAGATAPSGDKARKQSTQPSRLRCFEKDEGERGAVRGWPGHPDPGRPSFSRST
jgi:hypothetical protein